MPYHITTARTEPAHTIIFVVALLTLLSQGLALALSWPLGLANFIIVGPVCLWGVWSAKKNNMKHMAYSSFWLFLLWLWTGLNRLFFVEGVGELLWVPFIILGIVMGVTYLHTSFKQRLLDANRNGDID